MVAVPQYVRSRRILVKRYDISDAAVSERNLITSLV